jgi:hypothetical protein
MPRRALRIFMRAIYATVLLIGACDMGAATPTTPAVSSNDPWAVTETHEPVPAVDPAPVAPVPEFGDDAPLEPAAYAAWLHGLSPGDRTRVQTICKTDVLEYHRACNGIGPLRVSRPPDLMKLPPTTTRAGWLASLTPAQRRWVQRTCQHNVNQGELCTTGTPLVASFDDAPVAFVQGAQFAFDGAPEPTDWPTARTPWLALDRDGDGAITTGAELFGTYTPGNAGGDGFTALAQLDTNGDGVIDARDPAFAALVLWPAPADRTIVSISLAAHAVHRCDARGNCEGLEASMQWRDARGELHAVRVIDVFLPFR